MVGSWAICKKSYELDNDDERHSGFIRLYNYEACHRHHLILDFFSYDPFCSKVQYLRYIQNIIYIYIFYASVKKDAETLMYEPV